MNAAWSLNANDQNLLQTLLDFVPPKVYDFHAHIHEVTDLNMTTPKFWPDGPRKTTIDIWRGHLSEIFPGSDIAGGLFFPAPFPHNDNIVSNDFLVTELEKNKTSRGLILVSPSDKPEDIKRYLSHPQIVGFKPYYTYSTETPKMQSSMKGFFPEWQWKIAHEYRCIVMMHLVKDAAIADEENLTEIREMCEVYPEIKLILAHVARSFHWPNATHISKLRGLRNVYFDMSAVCEAEAIIIMLREFGPTRLMWGSDFPISQLRGRPVTLSNGFIWMSDGNTDWSQSPFAQPTIIGIESLRALRSACMQMGLDKTDIGNIFYGNASRILALDEADSEITKKKYEHAKSRIPGGVQLLSKRPENMAPGRWPAYFSEARGTEIWDLDGNHYYDMSTNGIGACLLGYRDNEVTRAVIRRAEMGNMCSLNPPEEVDLADLLCGIHPWADKVRFARGGGEACGIAIRIARATTDRTIVAICGYHGWQDWYLAANLGETEALRDHLLPGLNTRGVPGELRGTTVTFKFNDREGFSSIIEKYGPRLAAVIMEPCRNTDPEPGFLEFIRESTRACGALLIFDEVTVGWRMHFGGVHLKFGVYPDMAVFAKSLGNGHPVAAVIGTGSAMQGAHTSFISSTYWTEGIGPAAAIATLGKMSKLNVPKLVENPGKKVMEVWMESGLKFNLPVNVGGYACMPHLNFRHPDSEKLRTLYTQLMLDRGFLAGLTFYPTVAHTPDIVESYQKAVKEVFGEIAEAIHNKSLDEAMRGSVALSGFARLI